MTQRKGENIRRGLVVAGVVVVVVAAFASGYVARTGDVGTRMSGMDGQPQRGTVPAVKGYLDGHEILFIHTEASDPQVAQMLTRMMGSPVIVVRSLGQVPPSVLANVYVFQNGVKGEGPFGYQADVFDRPPTLEDYSPLRAVQVVKWTDETKARVLRSADDVRRAEARGDVTVERLGAVVNMPLLTWPGGQR